MCIIRVHACVHGNILQLVVGRIHLNLIFKVKNNQSNLKKQIVYNKLYHLLVVQGNNHN